MTQKETAARLHRLASYTRCARLSINPIWTAQRGREREDLPAPKHTQKLRISTPTQRLTKYTSGSIISSPLNWAVAELHHNLRPSQPSEIFLQIKFHIDNWSAHWSFGNFPLQPAVMVMTIQTYGLETANLMQCDCLKAHTKFFNATIKIYESTALFCMLWDNMALWWFRSRSRLQMSL